MTAIRCLTVRQPWAWAIAHAGKTVENRTHRTEYRGPIAIHSALTWSQPGLEDRRVRAALTRYARRRTFTADLIELAADAGVIIATATIVDCHPSAGCCDPWGEDYFTDADGNIHADVWHWVLDRIRPLREHVPARGQLGLWKPGPAVLAELEAAR